MDSDPLRKASQDLKSSKETLGGGVKGECEGNEGGVDPDGKGIVGCFMGDEFGAMLLILAVSKHIII